MKWIWISLACVRETRNSYIGEQMACMGSYSKQLSTLLWAITITLGYALYDSFQLYLPLETEKPAHTAFVREQYGRVLCQ